MPPLKLAVLLGDPRLSYPYARDGKFGDEETQAVAHLKDALARIDGIDVERRLVVAAVVRRPDGPPAGAEADSRSAAWLAAVARAVSLWVSLLETRASACHAYC